MSLSGCFGNSDIKINDDTTEKIAKLIVITVDVELMEQKERV